MYSLLAKKTLALNSQTISNFPKNQKLQYQSPTLNPTTGQYSFLRHKILSSSTTILGNEIRFYITSNNLLKEVKSKKETKIKEEALEAPKSPTTKTKSSKAKAKLEVEETLPVKKVKDKESKNTKKSSTASTTDLGTPKTSSKAKKAVVDESASSKADAKSTSASKTKKSTKKISSSEQEALELVETTKSQEVVKKASVLRKSKSLSDLGSDSAKSSKKKSTETEAASKSKKKTEKQDEAQTTTTKAKRTSSKKTEAKQAELTEESAKSTKTVKKTSKKSETDSTIEATEDAKPRSKWTINTLSKSSKSSVVEASENVPKPRSKWTISVTALNPSALDFAVDSTESTKASELNLKEETSQSDKEFIITDELVSLISTDLNIGHQSVLNTLTLLQQGNTVPFITRYRKEQIGSINEDQIRSIHKSAVQYTNLQARKKTVLDSIRTNHPDQLTPELEAEILSSATMRHLEDLYAPFKPKKNSLADAAISKGLLKPAEYLLSKVVKNKEFDQLLKSYIDPEKKLETIEDVKLGVQHIIAEKISDSVHVRDAIRPVYAEFGSIVVTGSQSSQNEIQPPKSVLQPNRKRAENFAHYFDYNKPISSLKAHNILAINRGEKEKFLKVKFCVPEPTIITNMSLALSKQYPSVAELFLNVNNNSESSQDGKASKSASNTSQVSEESSDNSSVYTIPRHLKSSSSHLNLISDAIVDSFKRLLHPSLVNESRSTLTENAESQSIQIFGNNLKNLLMTPPMSNHVILGIDPGFTNGCKTCVIDQSGKVLMTQVMYPLTGQKSRSDSAKVLDYLVKEYSVTLIAIGNGTAHKQTAEFIKEYIDSTKQYGDLYRSERGLPELEWTFVQENGASVYSVSKEAAKEFPNMDPAGRGAVSIARRLLDPLAEIVKIPTQSIGVGMYQHDVNQKELEESLGAVVEDCVNRVGVNLNTASPSLLRRISGISSSQASNIVQHRETEGTFKTRSELMKVKGIGQRTYTQAAGFLRIPDSPEPLDNTNIHPEAYEKVRTLLKSIKFTTDDILDPKKRNQLHKKLDSLNLEKVAQQLDLGVPTLHDIIADLKKPGRDPRSVGSMMKIENNISSIDEIEVGQILKGRVVNVTSFGAFVDVGVEKCGLVLPKDVIDSTTNMPIQQFYLMVHSGLISEFAVVNVEKPRQRFNLRLTLTDQSKLM